MAAPVACTICGRCCPTGGVPDDVGRPVHYWCRAVAKLERAEHARATAKRVAREGRPASKALLDRVA